MTIEVRVVDDGREKIEGLDQCGLVVETVDGRVVGRGGPDEEIFIRKLGEPAQNLREFILREFGCSSRAGGKLGETFDVFA